MKAKAQPENKNTSVTVTTKTSLTIHGQTFEMTLDELKALHDKIGKAIGADKPVWLPPVQPRRLPYSDRFPSYPTPWPGDRIMCLMGD